MKRIGSKELAVLTEHLLKTYPPRHEVVLYEAARPDQKNESSFLEQVITAQYWTRFEFKFVRHYESRAGSVVPSAPDHVFLKREILHRARPLGQ